MKRLALVALALTLGGCGDPTIGVGDWQPRSVADDKQLKELAVWVDEQKKAAPVARPQTSDASIKRVEIERMSFGEGVTVIHDDKRNVTCWVYSTLSAGSGISCTPDWMLTPPKVKS